MTKRQSDAVRRKRFLERKAPPTFDVIIEIIEVDKLAIHHDVAKVVDKLLRGQQPRPEIRVPQSWRRGGGSSARRDAARSTGRTDRRKPMGMTFDPQEPSVMRGGGIREIGGGNMTGGGMDGEPPAKRNLPQIVRIFPYGVSRSRLERALSNLRVSAVVSKDMHDADVVIALKATFRREPAKLQEARSRSLGAYVVKSNTYIQIEKRRSGNLWYGRRRPSKRMKRLL